MDASFPSQKRLLKNSEFSAVFKARRVIRGKRCTLHYQKITQDFPRLGLVVSKKSLKRAVERNRFKRIAREAFRQNTLPAWNFVLRFTEKNARLTPFAKQDLRLEIEALFQLLRP